MHRFFQSGEKYNDFSKWSYCKEQPAQVENTKIFPSGEKYKDFSKWSCCDGDLPRWKIIKSMRNTKISQNGLIVMGYQPK